jgi:hypothetical protein
MQNGLFTDPSSNFTHIQNYCVNLFLVKISVQTARKAVLKEQMDAKTPIFEFLHSLRSKLTDEKLWRQWAFGKWTYWLFFRNHV